MGFPIRRFLDQSSFAAPQDFSQRTTSFIASQRQGIHQMLLRHLITLMIDVRSAEPDIIIKERPVLRISPKTCFCLPSISGARRLRAVSWFAGLGGPLAEYAASLRFQTSAHPNKRGGANLNDTGYVHTIERGSWWSLSGSNRRPEACKATALPAELRPQTR